MYRLTIISLLIGAILFLGCNSDNSGKDDHAHRVELKQEDGQYRLYLNDEEFYVKGAGLEFGNIERLAANGGNSFRTWRTDNGQRSGKEVLDEAHEHGLMVLMGIEIGRERHGYDYNDTAWVREQYESVKKQVLELKDHPAILGWAIGNELNLRATNNKVWDAVNDISIMIHEIDGNHPTTTTFAGFSKDDAKNYMERCTDMDFVSIQMYGDILNLQKYIKESGYQGPYMVTEWGATGHWEVPKTEWDIAIEQTSTEKAKAVKERWEKAIKPDTENCLGSYVFLWGQKQERTPSWYGLFTERGNETEIIDVMYEAWNGEKPENTCPKLDSIAVNGLSRYNNVYLEAESENLLFVDAFDEENDSLKMQVEIIPDKPEVYQDGGDLEERPKAVISTDNMAYQKEFDFRAPKEEGPYRIFVYITDGHGNAATANVPFFVNK